ncbi:hypothetical protein TRICI_002401 [Trichomonascus ciferrii]|uniref:UDP-N-acetylglucosamine transferase subunit ALG13 n=1 Tax=Trichomonascus ciferrii TaxID=44093 RepID=A0A642V628_9ASCO|nr:hypothetical protein TRICI_002401 [Trichomonascus ciferrii]
MTDGGVVLVTTGATIPFEALIRSVLSEAVLKKFAELGFGKLLVQYGKGEKLFHACTAEHGNQPLTISGFDFVPDLGETMKQADLVISHAGTGSILDALRAGKKLIVVVNDSLMENHQLEIANEFANSNYLLMSNPSTS